ncbi:alpha/beta hydrolase [Saccharopolyspora rhizosphaerae]|uniref:Alpha/beta hydrolase n=1 Tax=Saccharopolyspora rhizosphaerae TaxID=2492662 RepID=A0A3R8P3M8_9PSEU|nr:alpha/beta hydrolase [Saccharopolyspora rhizosphaerae]RRO15667.1 alpha/beta hydrolase [Saccharopolyspora rhizosphaerae]
MDSESYARFLPASYRRRASEVAPTSTWWNWRGGRVHIARAAAPEASARALVVHGAAGYSAALWPVCAPIAGMAEVLMPDLPPYGSSVVPRPGRIRYGDWVELLCELVLVESRRDNRPLVLVGASMGGMLAYEVAARTGLASAVVATCLLDPSDPVARRHAARGAVGSVPLPALALLERIAGSVRVPMRWLADEHKMSRNPELSALCAADPKGGGAATPLGLLTSFARFEHTPPENFTDTPVVLTHPAADDWTPPELSTRFLDRVKAPTTLVVLENCGHYPAEEPGLTQLAETLYSLIGNTLGDCAQA